MITMYSVIRAGRREDLLPSVFWTRVRAGWLERSDLVLARDGFFHPADQFPDLLPHLPRIEGPSLGKLLLGAGVVFGGLWLLGKALEPSPKPKRRRLRNTKPVEVWKKDYVSARDGWRCTYCGVRVTRRTRHIDHSVSRVNGGTNHLNNLRTACEPCNLEKGWLNARQFVR